MQGVTGMAADTATAAEGEPAEVTVSGGAATGGAIPVIESVASESERGTNGIEGGAHAAAEGAIAQTLAISAGPSPALDGGAQLTGDRPSDPFRRP